MNKIIINDFTIDIATTNGSGSLSANNLLTKAIFRMGIAVTSKNIFPSNIQGMPTWYSIRVSQSGFLCRHHETNITLAMNAASILEDIPRIKSGGVFLYNDSLKFEHRHLRSDLQNIPIPCRLLVDEITTGIKIKTLLMNMIYVGTLARLIDLDQTILVQTVKDYFKGKESILEINLKAVLKGWQWANDHLDTGQFPFKLKQSSFNDKKILIDGNTAAAIGNLYGGCTFTAWYPITPASSLIENFEKYAKTNLQNDQKKNLFACIQAEDELAAISMVTGAGWAGARAMTATSGPGLSLMAECAGLCYYAEIPAVIWDIQRVGPSTGLPTRTQQSDLLSAAFLSHGDTKHVLLFPATPEECFEFAKTSLDLAEQLQTLVIVLSDLDLGMNSLICNDFTYPQEDFKRGKLITAEELNQGVQFARYKDVDNDGIPYRTLPGTPHSSSSYFTRGTGHSEEGTYSESGETYEKNILRLQKKWETAKTLVPMPIIEKQNCDIGFISFGTSLYAVEEARWLLKQNNISSSHLRVRSFPFANQIKDYIESHQTIYVVDQNSEGQMRQLLTLSFPEVANRLRSICHFDGLPITAQNVLRGVNHEHS